MIKHVLCPDKFWDRRHNKNNKLLRNYFNIRHRRQQQPTKEIITNQNNNNEINNKSNNRNDLSKTTYRFNCLNTQCFYLFMITIYCCCVIITATPGLIDSPSEFLVKNVQNYNSNNNNSYSSNNIKINNNSNAAIKNFIDKSSNSIQSRKILEASNLAADGEEYIEDDDEDFYEYENIISNKSAKGMYIGAPCEVACHKKLNHVFCDPTSNKCDCERNYPVIIGLRKGCAKPKKLGEQCFYHQTCLYNDVNSLCVQVSHNALCQCADGFHSVSYSKPTKRVFCTQDLAVLTSDLPTLLGVTTGIAVLAGLICMVLHLFSKTKYPRHRNFADANIPPPIMYSSDTGIPLTVQSGRPSSRSSLRSSGSIGSYGNRRPSSAPATGSKGVLVSTSRTGSRRPSLASIHSTSSSVRSYSMMRFEKEAQQKELRQEMKLRLARLQHQQTYSHNKPQIIVGDAMSQHHGAISKVIMPTPSPLTPNSTDELLPSVDETQEFAPKIDERDEVTHCVVYNGPCTSSSEAL